MVKEDVHNVPFKVVQFAPLPQIKFVNNAIQHLIWLQQATNVFIMDNTKSVNSEKDLMKINNVHSARFKTVKDVIHL